MTVEFETLVRPAQDTGRVHAPKPTAPIDPRLLIVRDAMLAICDGKWNDAAEALARDAELAKRDAVLLNLMGVVFQARGQWRKARRSFGKSMRVDSGFAPAEQNMRRLV